MSGIVRAFLAKLVGLELIVDDVVGLRGRFLVMEDIFGVLALNGVWNLDEMCNQIFGRGCCEKFPIGRDAFSSIEEGVGRKIHVPVKSHYLHRGHPEVARSP